MLTNIYNRFRRITTNQLYFPEIDGIRFLAIVLVLLFHTHGYFIGKSAIKFIDDPTHYDLLNTLLINGDRGVELFFVLSGFILCLPFAHHYINQGKKVSLKKYYLRRVTRLEPPYFIAMTAIFLLHIVTRMPAPQQPLPGWTASWLASLIYAHGIIYHHNPLITVVAWSLEIEIQFYLLAPLLFSILSLSRFTRRSILCTAALALIIAHKLYQPPFLSLYRFGQYFLTGILLADFYVSDTAATLYNKKWIPIPALLCLIAIIYLPLKNASITPDVLLAARLCFPFLLGLFYYCVLKNDTLRKVFSYKFIPIIGGMCYSIYLLHYTIISIFGRYTLQLHITNYYLPNLLLQVALLAIPVLLISSVFYYYIERPFMSKKWMDMLMKKDKKDADTNMQG
jgi:peptidoglycan/LPS O-acetylase OafA/YrhL